MRRGVSRLLIGLFAGLLSITGASAQPVGTADPFAVQAASTILTVDIDRLFSQSQFGQRIGEDYAQASAALATENRRIADGLREEELALTAQRGEMAADVFRIEAEAFDEKAQGIRRAQDAKEAALENTLIEGRNQFLEATRPILGQLMVDRGAFAILDRRSVLLSLGSIDVTDEAIARINAAIGDGAGIAQDAPDPDMETPPDTPSDAPSENE